MANPEPTAPLASPAAPRALELAALLPRLDHAFWTGFLALVAVVVTTLGVQLATQRGRREVVHRMEVARTAQETRLLVIDRATEIREYLLSGDRAALAPDVAVQARVAARLDSLAALTSDDALTARLALDARRTYADWDSLYARRMLDSISAGAVAPLGVVGGTSLFDQFRMSINALISAEDARLSAALQRERSVSLVGLALVVTELLAIAIVLMGFRGRALVQGKRLQEQQETLEHQGLEIEARAMAFEREAMRSRSLAEYLRSSNQDLRESVEALQRARAEAEAATRERDETGFTLDLVLANAPFGIALLDRNLRFERVNESLAALGRLSIKECHGRHVRDVLPALASSLEPILADALRGERPVIGAEFETAVPTASGRAKRWTVNAYPVVSRDGGVRGVGAIIIDTTERRQLERQLLEAQKMEAVGRLAGSIAHDFNNLLTAVSAFAQFAREEVGEAHGAREDLDQILLATERGTALTRRLLAFSRKQVVQPRSLDPNRLIASVQGLLERLLGEDVKLVTRLAPDLWPVDLDPGQLEQVIVNLAVNSRDAMPNGGRLVIETQNVELDAEYVAAHAGASTGPHVMLSVVDTGEGMDAATQAHIFEPFFTTKPVGKGTGLGLSTVHGIVAQAGGNIWLYSEPGRGTTFKVYFPRSRHVAESVTATQPAAPAPALPAMTVLLVDDDAAIRHVVRRVLVRHGCTVHDAENGQRALEILDRMAGAFDLALTDVIMPEMGGLEFSRRLRERWPRVRLMFMSGYTVETAQREALVESGAVFVEKPFTSESLLAKIHEAIDPGAAEGAAA